MDGRCGYVVACGKPEMTEGRGHVDCGVDPAWWWVTVGQRDRVRRVNLQASSFKLHQSSCLSSSAQSLVPPLPAGYVLCAHINVL